VWIINCLNVKTDKIYKPLFFIKEERYDCKMNKYSKEARFFLTIMTFYVVRIVPKSLIEQPSTSPGRGLPIQSLDWYTSGCNTEVRTVAHSWCHDPCTLKTPSVDFERVRISHRNKRLFLSFLPNVNAPFFSSVYKSYCPCCHIPLPFLYNLYILLNLLWPCMCMN
jgi:hypothetical protein